MRGKHTLAIRKESSRKEQDSNRNFLKLLSYTGRMQKWQYLLTLASMICSQKMNIAEKEKRKRMETEEMGP